MAAFWLGAKLEEVIEIDSPTKLRLRDVLTVFYRLIRRREGRGLEVLDPYSKVGGWCWWGACVCVVMVVDTFSKVGGVVGACSNESK